MCFSVEILAMGGWLDWIISEVFCSLGDFMTLFYELNPTPVGIPLPASLELQKRTFPPLLSTPVFYNLPFSAASFFHVLLYFMSFGSAQHSSPSLPALEMELQCCSSSFT